VLTRAEARQGKSNEHVYPQWFLKEFKLYGQVTKPTITAPDGRVVRTRTHVLGSYKAGRVCEGCNNGWMARLEGAAKPLLISLMRAQRPLSALDEAERLLVARWALKTACAVDLAFGGKDPLRIHSEHRLALCREEPALPPLISVYAVQHRPSIPVYPRVAGNFPLIARDPLRSDLILLPNRASQLADDFERLLGEHLRDTSTPRAYKVGLHLQSLVLGVFFWPLSYGYLCNPILHQIMWLDPNHGLVPTEMDAARWNQLQSLKSSPFVKAFLDNLMIAVDH
jgi:hypothetical protein